MPVRGNTKAIFAVLVHQVFFTSTVFAVEQVPKELQGAWGKNCLAPDVIMGPSTLTISGFPHGVDEVKNYAGSYKINSGSEYRLFRVIDGKLLQEATYARGQLETTKKAPLEWCDPKRIQALKDERWKAMSSRNSGKQEVLEPIKDRSNLVYPKEPSGRKELTFAPAIDGGVRVIGGPIGVSKGVYGLQAFHIMLNAARSEYNGQCVDAFSKAIFQINARGENDYNAIQAQEASLYMPACIMAYGSRAE